MEIASFVIDHSKLNSVKRQLKNTSIARDPMIKIHQRYSRLQISSDCVRQYNFRTQGVFKGVEKDWLCQILLQVTASSFFGHFKNIQILKKQKASDGNRTRHVFVIAHKGLHYAIESSVTRQFNQIIKLLSITKTVIYFTIYGKLMLSRKLTI